MGFVDAFARQIPVPGEPEEWMSLRPLSFSELDAARTAGYLGAMRMVGEMADVPALIDRVMSAQQQASSDAEADEALARAQADPLAGLHVLTVLQAGIVAWSYDRPVNEPNINLLDDATARWAAAAIVGLHDGEQLEKSSALSTKS